MSMDFRLFLVQVYCNAEGQDVAEYAVMLAVILGLVVSLVRIWLDPTRV